MKNIIKEALNLIQYVLKFILYLPNLGQPLTLRQLQKVTIVANGPSLKHDLPFLLTQTNVTDFIVVNFFAVEPSFFIIKPKFYCFADPMFFGSTHNDERVKALFWILENKVDWELSIYVTSARLRSFLSFTNFKNKYIKVLSFNEIIYNGQSSIKYFLYKKSLACPQLQNVSVLATYIGLTLGYKKLDLYGVDYSFLVNIEVNEKNQLCNRESYFYESESKLKPILKNWNGIQWSVSEYLDAISLMFKGHDDLAKYSKYLKVEVNNCTRGSFIDVYNRKHV